MITYCYHHDSLPNTSVYRYTAVAMESSAFNEIQHLPELWWHFSCEWPALIVYNVLYTFKNVATVLPKREFLWTSPTTVLCWPEPPQGCQKDQAKIWDCPYVLNPKKTPLKADLCWSNHKNVSNIPSTSPQNFKIHQNNVLRHIRDKWCTVQGTRKSMAYSADATCTWNSIQNTWQQAY